MRYSIQSIHKVFDTGDKPVLVLCDDLTDYVCKHNGHSNIAKRLFCELLSNELLDALGARTVRYDFVQVKEEHVSAQVNCQPAFFKNKTCFGSVYLHEALEFSQFPLDSYKQIRNREDLLKIAFFDLWLCNEDRNWNNFNLLMNPTQSGFEIVPIDHGACLNTVSFDMGTPLIQLTENETLILTEPFIKMTKGLLKTAKEADEFANSLYLSFPVLKQVYENAIAKIPADWNISDEFIKQLEQQLFSKEWFIETKMNFISYLKTALKIK